MWSLKKKKKLSSPLQSRCSVDCLTVTPPAFGSLVLVCSLPYSRYPCLFLLLVMKDAVILIMVHPDCCLPVMDGGRMEMFECLTVLADNISCWAFVWFWVVVFFLVVCVSFQEAADRKKNKTISGFPNGSLQTSGSQEDDSIHLYLEPLSASIQPKPLGCRLFLPTDVFF